MADIRNRIRVNAILRESDLGKQLAVDSGFRDTATLPKVKYHTLLICQCKMTAPVSALSGPPAWRWGTLPVGDAVRHGHIAARMATSDHPTPLGPSLSQNPTLSIKQGPNCRSTTSNPHAFGDIAVIPNQKYLTGRWDCYLCSCAVESQEPRVAESCPLVEQCSKTRQQPLGAVY
jgi:hypothetical protein